jgi:Ankyrin repeats (3 copies)/Ankyrin repeat
MKIPRRSFSVLLPGATAALWAQAPTQERPSRLDLEMVKDWVGKAHQPKLDPMRDLLRSEPNLINASWDWGSGDWESALQAAAHTGSREMALFLLDQGASVDLFASTMLGQLSALKSMFEAFPKSLSVRGAHGIPLLSHAVVGEAPSRSVFDYLLTRGVDVNASANNGMTPLMMAVQTAQRDLVQVLVGKGANVNAKAKNGQTPLTLSVKSEDAQITNLLKAAGATG